MTKSGVICHSSLDGTLAKPLLSRFLSNNKKKQPGLISQNAVCNETITSYVCVELYLYTPYTLIPVIPLIPLIQWNPDFRTLSFSNLPITRTKCHFPSSVKHCNFTPDFSNSPILSNQFLFPLEVCKIGIPLYPYTLIPLIPLIPIYPYTLISLIPL